MTPLKDPCVNLLRLHERPTAVLLCVFSAYSHSDADVLNQSLLEANIATEVCLTVLDTLSIFIMSFKVLNTIFTMYLL